MLARDWKCWVNVKIYMAMLHKKDIAVFAKLIKKNFFINLILRSRVIKLFCLLKLLGPITQKLSGQNPTDSKGWF